MWIRITDTSVKQIDANHIENPKNPGNPMLLDLAERESRTAFYVVKVKKAIPRYFETTAETQIPKRKWTNEMKAFAQQEVEKMPINTKRIKITIFGWILLIVSFSFLGYLIYQGSQEPKKMQEYEKEQAVLASVSEGEVYFGHFEKYKEKGNPIGMKVGFGWFRVVKINGDSYQIAKSTEMSNTSKPKETMNSSDFEEETISVKAKELESYRKIFLSEDELIEIYFNDEKK